MWDFTKPILLEWWQVSIFKVTLASAGILLALYFPKFFKKYKNLWWIVTVVGSVYLFFVWLYK